MYNLKSQVEVSSEKQFKEIRKSLSDAEIKSQSFSIIVAGIVLSLLFQALVFDLYYSSRQAIPFFTSLCLGIGILLGLIKLSEWFQRQAFGNSKLKYYYSFREQICKIVTVKESECNEIKRVSTTLSEIDWKTFELALETPDYIFLLLRDKLELFSPRKCYPIIKSRFIQNEQLMQIQELLRTNIKTYKCLNNIQNNWKIYHHKLFLPLLFLIHCCLTVIIVNRDAELFSSIGRSAAEMKQYSTAVSSFQKAIFIESSLPQAVRQNKQLAYFYWYKGWCEYQLKLYAEALIDARKAKKLYQNVQQEESPSDLVNELEKNIQQKLTN